MAFFIFLEYVASSLNSGTLLAALRKVLVILLVPIVVKQDNYSIGLVLETRSEYRI